MADANNQALARQAAPWALLALGLALAGALWTTGPAIPGKPWMPRFLEGYLIAWLLYVAVAIIVGRGGKLPRWALVWIVAAAVGMRIVCLARTPPLSTDVWRYLWDGRVINAGINPYRYPPEAADESKPSLRPAGRPYPANADVKALRALRDQRWKRISYKWVPTIYPPLAEALFAGLARLRSRDAEAFRWTFALFDMGSILVLIALLRRTGRPPERVIWYAWCPLAATEATAGAHVDSVGLCLLLVALLLAGRPRPGSASAVALAGSVMLKGYAVLALPFFVRCGRWRLLLAFAATCLALLAPFLGAGHHLLGGLRAYLERWEANASIFLIVDGNLAKLTPDHFEITRKATTAAVLLVVAALAWRQKPALWPAGKSGMGWLLGATFAAIGAQLLLGAPTFPWYVIWVVPALCWWEIPGLVLFSLTVSLQYYGRALWSGDRAAQYALLWAGYLPVYALLIGQSVWWLLRRRRSAPAPAPCTPSNASHV